ncbi:MAG: hypothetical protein O7F74_12465 [Bacteroidetes bacterium]|nr:hypothetical protein [Bacteroidota bacterium]
MIRDQSVKVDDLSGRVPHDIYLVLKAASAHYTITRKCSTSFHSLQHLPIQPLRRFVL